MFNSKPKIYLARGMSGRNKADVVTEARIDKEFLEKAGLVVLCPVSEEKVKAENKVLQSTQKAMQTYWFRDKAMIREANVVFDMTPHLKSEGVAHELGYARFHLWKPVVRVYPLGQLPPKASIAFFEGDAVVDSLEEAIEFVYRVHGTWFKRLKWRMGIYNQSWVKAAYYKLMEWGK